jgi:hypothetical protein
MTFRLTIAQQPLVWHDAAANPPFGQALISASFFNAGTGDPNDDVGATLAFGRSPSDPPGELFAYAQIFHGNQYGIGFVSLGSSSLGTPMTASLAWDQPNHQFLASWTNKTTHTTTAATLPTASDTAPPVNLRRYWRSATFRRTVLRTQHSSTSTHFSTMYISLTDSLHRVALQRSHHARTTIEVTLVFAAGVTCRSEKRCVPGTDLMKCLNMILGLVLALQSAAVARAQTQEPPGTKPDGVYYFAYRTPAHVSRSSPDVFHGVANEILDLLKKSDVNVIADPERGSIETNELFSLESLLSLMRARYRSYEMFKPAFSFRPCVAK